MNTPAKPTLPITSANRGDARKWLTQFVPYRAIAAAPVAELERLISDPAALEAERQRYAAPATPIPAQNPHTTPPAPMLPDSLAQQIASLIAGAMPATASTPDADTAAGIMDAIDDLQIEITNLAPKAAVARAESKISDLWEHVDTNLDNLRAEAVMSQNELKTINARLAALGTAGTAALESRIDAIESALSAAPAPVKAKAALAVSAGKNPILNKLTPYYQAGTDNKATICVILSAPSFGKSHTVRQLGKTYDVFLEHGCSDDMDEMSSLIGTVAPDGKGGFVTVDGVLTQAMRAASAGNNVLLFLDEVFRMSGRVQEALLMFLAPQRGAYTLRTRKALSCGNFETLEASTDRLHIVAASNLTNSIPQDAFWSRFKKTRIPFSVSALEEIASEILASYGLWGATTLSKAYADAMDKSRKLVKEGGLQYPLDLRILVRACQHGGSTEADLARYISAEIPDSVTLWDGMTGDDIPQSKTAADELVTLFKKAAGI